MLITCFKRGFLVVTVKNTRLVANLHISFQRVFNELQRLLNCSVRFTHILFVKGEYTYDKEFLKI